jgi:rubrerythrin
MPDFGNPFSGLKHDRKFTDQELVRAIRFMVAAEYEAIQLYQQLAESTDNKLAQAVLMDIADEEKVHAGEFLRLLKELDPQEEEFYQQGYKEVEDEFLSGASAEGAEPAAGESGGLGIGSLKKK